MLEVQKSRSVAAARDYFDRSLRVGDYYQEGQEIAGRWHGLAAARLGLAGDVTRRAFCALVDNRHPITGEKLTPRRKADRVPGFDFTFTAPKSVSALWGLTGDERIEEAFRQSVIDAMREAEREMKTRVRVGGRDEDRRTGNMVWGEFLHKTGRPIGGIPDPHLHIHAYAMNVTYDDMERRWKAAQIGDLKGEANWTEAVFHASLAKRLAALGYGIERHGRFFEIAGFDRDFLSRFSQRRDLIEQAAAAEGSVSPEAKKLLSRLTRERKAEHITIEELRDVWKARLGPKERNDYDRVVQEARHGLAAAPQADVRRLMAAELGDALKSESAVSEKSVLTKVLRKGFGAVIAGEAKAALEAHDIIRGEVGGRAWITTKEAHALEAKVVAFARNGRNRYRSLGSGDYGINARWMNHQQRAAIHHIWSSQDQVMIIRGGAGVGKTTLLTEAVAGVRAAGHRCFLFSSTIPSTEVLRAEGFSDAQTVQKLIANQELQMSVGEDAVIVADEAGLIDMETMGKLFDLAGKRHWRVILSGDEKQHTPVRRGDAMRLLRQRAHLPMAEVSEIVRQRGDYKRAVQAIEGGLVDDGWKQLEAMGAIIEASGAQRIERLAADYVQAVETGDSVLVVAPTNRERQAVTDTIRQALKGEGMLGKEEREVKFLRNLYWSETAKADAARYQGGQVVKFRQHARGAKAGEAFAIEGVSDTGKVYARDGEGALREVPIAAADRFDVYSEETKGFAVGDRVRIVERCPTLRGGALSKGSFHRITDFAPGGIVLDGAHVVPASFRFLDHGYGSTSVSSQGLTVNTVLIAMGAQSVPAISRETFYVSVSRGKRRVRLYVDDVKEVREAIRHSSARPSAHDLAENRIAADATRAQRLRSWRRRLARTAERMARETGQELDAGLIRTARDEVLIEYLGRVSSNAPVLGE